ncbi:hypothetical protein EJ08DRAFT_294168 [Tothia fuscella]|uniref:Uncharacterized protein n=1 Tax=Tothia fuscella TaxID=1048955 RepID=A0A9P4P1W7_9PEZI|nr:hypothetical protein EJ08DRAFT_294168 [Tothia fuscella]
MASCFNLKPRVSSPTKDTEMRIRFSKMEIGSKKKNNNKKQKDQGAKSGLLNLPAETRNQIYHEVFTSRFTGSKNLAPLLICRQINQEASILAWCNTTFKFESLNLSKFRCRLQDLPEYKAACIETLELPWIQLEELHKKELDRIPQDSADFVRWLSRRTALRAIDAHDHDHPRVLLERYLPNLKHLIASPVPGYGRSNYNTHITHAGQRPRNGPIPNPIFPDYRTEHFWSMVGLTKYPKVSLKVDGERESAPMVLSNMCVGFALVTKLKARVNAKTNPSMDPVLPILGPYDPAIDATSFTYTRDNSISPNATVTIIEEDWETDDEEEDEESRGSLLSSVLAQKTTRPRRRLGERLLDRFHATMRTVFLFMLFLVYFRF